jgi:fluoroquinolone transport system permease protein
MSWVSDWMPSRSLALVMGDWQRFRKYHLLTANLVLLTIWILATLAMDTEQLTQFLPFIFLMDTTVMTMVLIGTAIFYEKQEHTIDAILTSPVSETEYLSAKVTIGIVNSLVTLAFVTVTIWLVKGVTFNHWAFLPPAIIVMAGFHAMLGIALTYGAKDFTAIMLRSVVYMFLIWLPAVFTLFGLIPAAVVPYLLILPPVSGARLLTAGVLTVAGWQLVFGYLHLVTVWAVLYVGVVKRGFQRYVVREIGV